jgi:predicted RecB family nuclease
MQKVGTTLMLGAYDLVDNPYCAHLTGVDLKVAQGLLPKPFRWDPLLDILRERGRKHEQAFLNHLRANGFDPFLIEGIEVTDEAVAQTREAMQAGRAIIVQAAVRDGNWVGRADILRRVETPSDLGDWSYEFIDTKLARETKGGTVLQLCLYAQLLAAMQGVEPEFVYVAVVRLSPAAISHCRLYGVLLQGAVRRPDGGGRRQRPYQHRLS